MNQNYNSELFDKKYWENKSFEEIKKKINLEKIKKNNLKNEKKIRENYLKDLKKEIEIQTKLNQNVSELILKCDENLNSLKLYF